MIQPGIEALSTSLLKRMDKGVAARQNIALLRYARSVDLSLSWNLLYQIPGDRLEEYQQTLDLLPLLRHLHPPSGLLPLMIDRFSPYYDNPAKHGVRNLRPWESYAEILPAHAEVAKVAYHFDGDYDSESRENPAVMRAIAGQVDAWRHCWESDGPPPSLAVVPITGEQFLLHDTRGLPGTLEIQFLTREQASVALAGARDHSETVNWALQRRLLVRLDSSLVPLATAEPGLIEEFEAEARRAAIGRPVLASLREPNAAPSVGHPLRLDSRGTRLMSLDATWLFVSLIPGAIGFGWWSRGRSSSAGRSSSPGCCSWSIRISRPPCCRWSDRRGDSLRALVRPACWVVRGLPRIRSFLTPASRW